MIQAPNFGLPVYICRKIKHDFEPDCRLDNPVWQKCESICLADTVTGANSRFQTKVQALFSGKYFYVRFYCEDDYIWGTITDPNGPIYLEECVEVFLNPANPGDQYYEINLSPKNVLYAARILNDRTPDFPEKNYKVLPMCCKHIKSAVSIDGFINSPGKAKAWTAEYAIPLTEIAGAVNSPPCIGDIWRVNFYRIDFPANGQQEYYSWSTTGKPDFHLPWRFGYLIFQD